MNAIPNKLLNCDITQIDLPYIDQLIDLKQLSFPQTDEPFNCFWQLCSHYQNNNDRLQYLLIEFLSQYTNNILANDEMDLLLYNGNKLHNLGYLTNLLRLFNIPDKKYISYLYMKIQCQLTYPKTKELYNKFKTAVNFNYVFIAFVHFKISNYRVKFYNTNLSPNKVRKYFSKILLEIIPYYKSTNNLVEIYNFVYQVIDDRDYNCDNLHELLTLIDLLPNPY